MSHTSTSTAETVDTLHLASQTTEESSVANSINNPSEYSLSAPIPSPSLNANGGSLHRFKLVLLGESGVGKTSLAHRFVKDQFSEQFDSTIGSAFFAPTVWLGEKEGPAKLEIWDTAGQERYRSLAPLYYRGAHAALIVYDLTDRSSFAKTKGWIDELNGQKRSADPHNLLLALVGNKADLADNRRKVSWKEAQTNAAENGLMFIETSAKTAQNVSELFVSAAKKLVENKKGKTVADGGGFQVGEGENRANQEMFKNILCCQ